MCHNAFDQFAVVLFMETNIIWAIKNSHDYQWQYNLPQLTPHSPQIELLYTA